MEVVQIEIGSDLTTEALSEIADDDEIITIPTRADMATYFSQINADDSVAPIVDSDDSKIISDVGSAPITFIEASAIGDGGE